MLCYMSDIISSLAKEYDISVYGEFPDYVREMKKLPKDSTVLLEKDTLYVATANDLEDYQESGKLVDVPVICSIGLDNKAEVSMLGRRTIIMVKGAVLPDILLYLTGVMFDLGMKESPLSEARNDLMLLKDHEAILKTAYKHLGLPIFVTSVTLKILSHSDSIEVALLSDLFTRDGCFDDEIRTATNRPEAVMGLSSLNRPDVFVSDVGGTWTLFSYPLYDRKNLNGYMLVFSGKGKMDKEQSDICLLLRNLIARDFGKFEHSHLMGETEESFIEGLIDARVTGEREISEQLSRLSWIPKKAMHIIVPSLNGLLPGRTIKESREQYAAILPNIRVYSMEKDCVMLYEGDNPLYVGEENDALAPLDAALRQAGLCVGISKCFRSFTEVRSAYFQATKAMTIGALLRKGKTLHYYEDVSVYHMMEFSANYMDISNFFVSGIDKLLQMDKEEGKDYIRTLEVYVNCGGNMVSCAEKLFIHVNTIKYRIKQISDILHCDLRDGDAFFRASLSVKLLRYIENARYLLHPYSELQGMNLKK